MFDVIVVGAGMVGLSQALSLSQRGFQVALLEARPLMVEQELKTPTAKVVALNRASKIFLDQLGVWQKIASGPCAPYSTMTVWDNAGSGKITFSAAEFFEPDLGHIAQNSSIEAALLTALQKQQVVVYQTTATALRHYPHYAEIHTQTGAVLQAKLIVAADGAQSQLRSLCQIESDHEDYKQSALVTVVRGENPHKDTAYQCFASEGPLALLPRCDPSTVACVWTMDPSQAEALKSADKSVFERELTRVSEGVMGRLYERQAPRIVFPLYSHHAKRYFQGRCVLVGDAAHTLHPLAGQGVNLGFLDVFALTTLMEQTKQRQRDWGSEHMLQRYERARRTHNQMMIWAMRLFKQGFGRHNIPAIQYLRNVGLNWVDQHHTLKGLFAKAAWGMGAANNKS